MKLVLNIAPVAKGRPRFGRGHTYTPRKTRQFEQKLKALLQSVYAHEPLNQACFVNLVFYLERPKSVKRTFPMTRPDADNYTKAVIDAANGVLWQDDALICDLNMKKRYSEGAAYLEIEFGLL